MTLESARAGVKFGGSNDFQVELGRRVEAFFLATGRRPRDCWQMYLKTAILVGVFVTTYGLLLLGARTWWQALPLAVVLGLTAALIGFNVQHDGGHQAYSDRPWVNRLMAMSLDLLGGSSYVWHRKHTIYHHTHVNIAGQDPDIELGALARVAPHQPLRPAHRWQHVYLWLLYGFLAIKWHLVSDFRNILQRSVGGRHLSRPRGWELVTLLAGKGAFLTLAFGIPLLLHPAWAVLSVYGVAAIVLGLTLSVVFQLAHCVGEAEFPRPRPDTGRMERGWAIHQVETTVNFSRSSPVAAWLLGGLNFQVEHHLFPRICHVNYPAMSSLVEETCREFGVRYAAHRSFWAGVVSHFRWLKRMGAAAPGR